MKGVSLGNREYCGVEPEAVSYETSSSKAELEGVGASLLDGVEKLLPDSDAPEFVIVGFAFAL